MRQMSQGDFRQELARLAVVTAGVMVGSSVSLVAVAVVVVVTVACERGPMRERANVSDSPRRARRCTSPCENAEAARSSRLRPPPDLRPKPAEELP
jgi:hypothetical protein